MTVMFKRSVIFLSVGMAVVVAQAQPDAGERARTVEAVPAAHADGATSAQQRRAALREVLQSQRDGRAPPGAASGAVRQLNPQERAQLREQLRQQRPDGARPLP